MPLVGAKKKSILPVQISGTPELLTVFPLPSWPSSFSPLDVEHKDSVGCGVGRLLYTWEA
jgi:hypothetical protein